jgi:hypothetical protein
MARDSKIVTEEFDFTVDQRKTYIPHDGSYRWTGKFSNVRTDTGESLGDGITEQYGLLQNSVLVENLEEAFQGYSELKDWGQHTSTRTTNELGQLVKVNGFDKGKRDISITENGSRFFGRYEFNNPRTLGGGSKVGDTVGMAFILRNSFDRSCKAGLEGAAKRLACLNGMTSLVTLSSITARHSNKISVVTIKEGIESVIEEWHKSIDSFSQFAQRELKIDRDKGIDEGVFILNRLAQKKVLSESMKDSIELIWNEQSVGNGLGGEFDRDRNLWNLYNATTQHLTHTVQPKRFEYARLTEGKILGEFTRALGRKDVWETFISPCKAPRAIKMEKKAAKKKAEAAAV